MIDLAVDLVDIQDRGPLLVIIVGIGKGRTLRIGGRKVLGYPRSHFILLAGWNDVAWERISDEAGTGSAGRERIEDQHGIVGAGNP